MQFLILIVCLFNFILGGNRANAAAAGNALDFSLHQDFITPRSMGMGPMRQRKPILTERVSTMLARRSPSERGGIGA